MAEDQEKTRQELRSLSDAIDAERDLALDTYNALILCMRTLNDLPFTNPHVERAIRVCESVGTRWDMKANVSMDRIVNGERKGARA